MSNFGSLAPSGHRVTRDIVRVYSTSSSAGPTTAVGTSSLPRPTSDRVPWVANNDLRIERRTSQSIYLTWSPEDATACTSSTEVISVFTENRVHCSFYEVQIQKTGGLEKDWEIVYRGFKTKYEVTHLVADVSYNFRLKKSTDREWGSVIVGATDSSPPNAEDLHRAVSINSEDTVLRIISSSKVMHLKRLLVTHDRVGMTPLMIACQNGNLELVTMLMEAGSNVNFRSLSTEKTALMLACFSNFLEVVESLDRSGADWRLKDKSGCNAIHHAVNGGSSLVLEYAFKGNCPMDTINEGDALGWTPLMRAAIVGSLDVVKLLVKQGVHVNSTDKLNSKSCLMAAVILGKADIVRELLQSGADPNYLNSNAQCPLDIAFSIGERVIIELLLHAGGKISDYSGYDYDTGEPVFPNTTGSQLAAVYTRYTPEFRVTETFLDSQ